MISLATFTDATTRDAIDWLSPHWGGRVHIAANGSHVADRHIEQDDETAGAS